MRPARSDTVSQILGTNEIWTACAAVRLGHLHNIGNVASGSQRVSLPPQVIKTHLQPPLPLVTPDVKLGIGSLGLPVPMAPYSHHTPQHNTDNGKGELFGKLC